MQSIDAIAQGQPTHANDAVEISELTRALDAGQVDVAVHLLQLLLLTRNGDDRHELKARMQRKSVRVRRLKNLQRVVMKMLGDAEKDGGDDTLTLRPGLASRDAASSHELSYSQLQMFALQRLQPKNTAYNVVRALQFTGVAFDLLALKNTCDALMAKHEALRTSFDVDPNAAGQPRQQVHPLSHFKDPSIVRVVPTKLLRPGCGGEPINNSTLAEFVAKTIDEPFDLAQQAPIRIFAFIPPKMKSPWVVSVVLHHIVTDAASSQLFWDDFHTLYARFVRCKTIENSSLELVKQLGTQASSASHLTYRDFAVWERARMRSGVTAPSLQYWMQRLNDGGVPVLLELPYDHASPHTLDSKTCEGLRAPESTTVKGDVVVFRSSSSLQKAFSELCHAQGASIFMGLLAVFYLLIERLSRQQDFVIGVPSSGRTLAELQDIMGYFVNTLPLRLGGQRKSDENFNTFLEYVREIVLGSYKHMDIPFHKVLEHLRASAHSVDGDRGQRWQHPLFQVMFSWEQSNKAGNGDWSDDLSSNAYAELPLPHQSAKFDLMLSMRYRLVKPDTANAAEERVLEGSMEYPTARFARATVERFSVYYVELLEQVTRSPETPLCSPTLSMLPNSERQQLVNHWGVSKPTMSFSDVTGGSSSGLLHESLYNQVQKTPLNAALHFESTQWTYQDSWNHSRRVAQALDRIQTAGNGVVVHVGLLLDRGLENVAAMVGTLRVNGTFVPLDTEFPRERLRYMAHDSRLQVIITQQKHCDIAAELVAPEFTSTSNGLSNDDLKTRILFYEDIRDLAQEAKIFANGNTRKELLLLNQKLVASAAYILYTSGSTGKPKGVMVPHSALMTTLLWSVKTYNVTPSDMFLQSTSTTLDGSLSQLFSPLLVGGSARITRPKGLHDLHYMREVLFQEPHVTFCVFVPSYFSLLVDFLSDHGDAFPSSVKHVVLAGEAFPIELARQFYVKHEESTTCLVNEYGPTEASITSTAFRCTRKLALQTDFGAFQGLQSVPIGKPIDGHPVLVMDAQRRLVPVNVPGELYVGGAGVATGYWHRPDLTANSFIYHEDIPEISRLGGYSQGNGRRWYKTGDLVKWLPSGDLVFLGRTDAQVKHHGMRIELEEVRNVLLRHPFVKAAEVLIVHQPKPFGQKQREASSILVGFVMFNDGVNDQLSVKEPLDGLWSYLRDHLPRHMVPQSLRVVQQWPRTPNGKIDLRALGHSSDTCLSTSGTSRTATSNETMITVQFATDILRQVWMQAIGLELHEGDEEHNANLLEERLMTRSFFELGGDSLAAIRAIALAQARGLPLALDQFFRTSSLSEMARSAATSMLDFHELTSQTLVHLNCSAPGSSAERPTLFLFHDADGTVWKLLELARQLPFAVVGVQAPVNDTPESKLFSVEDLSKHYWKLIREKQSEGPFALGGFSFGCRLAHEVARLAVREGHSLLPLTLLDGLPFDLPSNQREDMPARRLRVEEYAIEAFGDENSPLWQLGVNYRKFCAMEEMYQPVVEIDSALSKPEPPVWLHAEVYMTERWNADVSRYRALGIDVTITLTVPNCTHLTMLRYPNVERVARKIRQNASRLPVA